MNNNQEFEALCARLLPKFNEYLLRRSKNVFACEMATSLEGISSLPALYSKNGVQKQVIAPLSMLVASVENEVGQAEAARVKAENDRVAAEKSRVSAESARVKAETTRQSGFHTALGKVSTAIATAEDTATHPTKVGTDNYIYTWDKENQKYVKTTIYVKGDKGDKMTLADLTDAEVAQLQKPATDAAARSDAQRAACKTQTDLAQELNDNPLKQGDNGNWWKYNPTTKAYEDTGIAAIGGILYPSFYNRRNHLILVDYQQYVSNRVSYNRNRLKIKI